MLTEQFVASVGIPTRPSGTSASKDAAIFVQEYQPLNIQRTVFKKSATSPNCLVVSTSHVFAAQTEKAVVHVYNREKGNQEATVPFTERITCLALACNESVLVLGTQEGRIFLWETASGRQITTSPSHLQAVTTLAVDPASNLLLSASADSTVHIWSIPALLSFSTSNVELPRPIRTFTTHRSKINALVLGHGSNFCNIAVSASADKTCLVWDYFTNSVLRTYLLPAEPVSLTLDVADRAVYVGYENGSVQQLDFFAQNSITGGTQSSTPIQPSKSSVWTPSDSSIGAALCLSICFDGGSLLSGHESGTILSWDVARGGSPNALLQAPLPGPVTNILFLPVTGFAEETPAKFTIRETVKPKFGAFDSRNGAVPGNYVLNVRLASDFQDIHQSEFLRALSGPTFPTTMIDDGLSELVTWGKGHHEEQNEYEETEDFMALDDGDQKPRELSLEEQNMALKSELEALRRLQRVSFEQLERINAEKKALIQREQKRISRDASIQSLSQPNGDRNNHRAIETFDSSSDED